jgi:hypothetical protein
VNSDPTEAARRKLVPEVNEQAVEAMNAANMLVTQVMGAETPVAEEEVAGILEQRDAMAKELLRARLAVSHGTDNVFDTAQLGEHFEVLGFMAPFVVVRRKADDKKGALEFTHQPRLYYNFRVDDR